MNTSPTTAIKAFAFALAILLAPAMVLGDGFLNVDLNYDFESGSETEVYVCGCFNKSATNITIPEVVVYEYVVLDEDGQGIVKQRTCRVTRIGRNAFSDCNALTSVTISASVTNIGEYAFCRCNGLTNVAIPDSVTSIGEHGFSDCSGLTSMAIPASVTNIGEYAFCRCSGLTNATIGNGVTRIGRDAFSGCSGLTSVTIGNNVTSIGYEAFSGCSSLTSVTIPDSVTSIWNAAFKGCSGLTSVTILGNVTNDTSPFINCTNLTTLVLGEEMTKVGNRMFYACSGLMSVTIPNNVTSIGNSAFENCSNLTSMAIGNGVTNIGTHVFSGCNSLESFSVASDNPAFKSVDGLLLTKDGKTLLYGVNGDVVIPDGVTELSTYAFNNYGELTSIVIPNSVIRFPTEAFDGCDKLWISWYRTLANLAAGSGASGGLPGDAGKTVSFTVTNVIVHYVTQSLPGDAVTPSTNSTGIVNIVAEVTAGKAIAISEDWAKQYPGFAEQYGADFSAALTMENGKRDGTGAPMYVWQDYVAGTDPTDPASVFTASVTFDAETGEPVISWSPELSPEEAAKRLYTVSGKVKMTDPDWLPLDGNASDFNFYRVTVEMK
ncbi:MAG: leucine-rich repeat domain-containing protein [Kiritimatiellae bacterium]|nr:leucine-rich repeat domain-containing protein [Kiritimatiellia bacterium]